MDLATIITEFFQRHRLDNTPGIVAVSGGADSVALAHLLVQALRTETIPRLILAHVNHQLRAEESDADEDFVRGLPLLWGMEHETRLTCRTRRIDAAAQAKADRDNLESSARAERYRWFAELAHTENAVWVATAHTEDDQAETVLFRLLRGSGILGLGAMSERRDLSEEATLIRPCLGLRRQQLLEYLQQQNLPFRVDSSNFDKRFTRNRLRLELLPQLQRDYNPAIVGILCRLATQAQELHEELAPAARQLMMEGELSRAGNILVFSLERLQKAPRNLVREMFRLVWQREGWPVGDMDFRRWNRLADIALGTFSDANFPGKIHARRVGRVMQLILQQAGKKERT